MWEQTTQRDFASDLRYQTSESYLTIISHSSHVISCSLHNLGAITALCHHVLLADQGEGEGPAAQQVFEEFKLRYSKIAVDLNKFELPPHEPIRDQSHAPVLTPTEDEAVGASASSLARVGLDEVEGLDFRPNHDRLAALPLLRPLLCRCQLNFSVPPARHKRLREVPHATSSVSARAEEDIVTTARCRPWSR
eukprot:767239-Hanusia_phi.AAC.6